MFYITPAPQPFKNAKPPKNPNFAKGLRYERHVFDYFADAGWDHLQLNTWFKYQALRNQKFRHAGPDFWVATNGDQPIDGTTLAGDHFGHGPEVLERNRREGKFIILGEAKFQLSKGSFGGTHEQVFKYKHILEHYYGRPVIPMVIAKVTERCDWGRVPAISEVLRHPLERGCFLIGHLV